MAIYAKIITASLFILSSAVAQNLWIVKAGANYSAFKDSDNELIGNYSFGISKEIILNEFLSFSPELLISSQGGMVRDKPVWSDGIESYLYSYSFRVAIQLIEFGILLNYRVINDLYKLSLNLGPSWRVGLHDESHRFNEKLIYDEDHPERREEFENYNFKYRLGESTFANSTGFAINLGLIIQYKAISFNPRYSVALHNIGFFSSLQEVKKKSHALHFLIGVLF